MELPKFFKPWIERQSQAQFIKNNTIYQDNFGNLSILTVRLP